MRKLILTMILGLAAGIAKADMMLYWTVDPKEKGAAEGASPLEYSYAVIYGGSGDNLDIYTALDAVTSGSGAIDTKVSGDKYQIPWLGDSMYENYIVRLFNDNKVTYVSDKYSYDSLTANVWAKDILSMKATEAVGFGNFRAVPEPTSGLLLLLGVAGLALKRKRA